MTPGDIRFTRAMRHHFASMIAGLDLRVFRPCVIAVAIGTHVYAVERRLSRTICESLLSGEQNAGGEAVLTTVEGVAECIHQVIVELHWLVKDVPILVFLPFIEFDFLQEVG